MTGEYFKGKWFWILPIALWAAAVASSLAWNVYSFERQSMRLEKEELRTMFNLLQITRQWNASHGGLYALVDKNTPPNPYIKTPGRDVTTTDGKSLTLVNPAYMTRQLSEMALGAEGLTFHLTSLKPVRPGNAADQWEANALADFENGGETERFELTSEAGGSGGYGLFRYIAPLKVTEECMACHAHQGYKVGDIRGGISVSEPAGPALAEMKKTRDGIVMVHGAIFVVMSVVLLILLRLIGTQWARLKSAKEAQDDAIAKLKSVNERLTAEISARVITEKELQLFALAVHNSPVSVVITDTAGNIEYANPRFSEITGYDTAELAGRNPRILKSGQTPPEVYDDLWQTISAGETWSGEFINKKKNGELYWEAASIAPIRNKFGATTNYVAVKEDVTKRKMLEEELRALGEILQNRLVQEIDARREKEQLLIEKSKLASMGEMIGAIAHQWRQPLNTLSALIQDVEDAWRFKEMDEAYINDMISQSMEQITFMSNTIGDFKGFFKTTKDKLPFNVKIAVGQVLSILMAELKVKAIETLVECPDDIPDVVGVVNEFKQVIFNLVNNAKDAISDKNNGTGGAATASSGGAATASSGGAATASSSGAATASSSGTPRGGRITIGVSHAADKVAVKVADNGGGIPSEFLEKIFEPNFTTKSEDKGTGIGLSMSKLIIEKSFDGSIRAENGPEGAVFTIELNVPAESTAEAKAEA
jgi:PAS domain S-box-containing protein